MGFDENLQLAGQWSAVLPEILMVVWATVVLVADLMTGGGIKRRTLGFLAAGGMLFILAVTALTLPLTSAQPMLGGMVRNDGWTWAFRIIFILGAALTCVAGIDFRATKAGGEFFALTIFAAMGMSLMAASSDLIMLFLATETASIALYLLAGFARGNKLSAEAGLKYFVFGAVASTVMLFGLVLMFGLSGATNYRPVAEALFRPEYRTIAVFASLLVIVGFAFKTSAVPFHFWAPDVYQGAPTPVAGFISTASKAAGFAILARFIWEVLPTDPEFIAGQAWSALLRPLALLTLVVGSFAALLQTNVKRMLAYSSVAQAGYMLIGIAAFAFAATLELKIEALAAVLFYIATYMLTNIGAFTVVGMVAQRMGGDDLKHFAGLGRKSPYLALGMTAALLSLLGAPPMVGFVGKLFLFRSAIGVSQTTGDTFLTVLVVTAVLMVLVSVVYYLNVVKAMYVDRSADDAKPIYVPTPAALVVLITGVGTIATTLVSTPLYDLAVASARSMLDIATVAVR
jgi:NADH-quinone oxidoreductase subunit N